MSAYISIPMSTFREVAPSEYEYRIMQRLPATQEIDLYWEAYALDDCSAFESAQFMLEAAREAWEPVSDEYKREFWIERRPVTQWERID